MLKKENGHVAQNHPRRGGNGRTWRCRPGPDQRVGSSLEVRPAVRLGLSPILPDLRRPGRAAELLLREEVHTVWVPRRQGLQLLLSSFVHPCGNPGLLVAGVAFCQSPSAKTLFLEHVRAV